jgi:hypothetical protein
VFEDDDDLPPPGLDLAGFFRLLAIRLGRKPSLSEVAAFRHDVGRERLRRIRLRKARKGTRRPAGAPAQKGRGGQPDPSTEFLTSLEWMLAMSLMASFVVSVGELAQLRLTGRRVTMRQSDLSAAAAALPVVFDKGDPALLGLPPRPLGSFTPDAVMLGFREVGRQRNDQMARMHGSYLYPRALSALLRSSGAPRGAIEGLPAWEIVESTDPAVSTYLHSLGHDPAEWGSLKIQVKQAQSRAAEYARRAANPAPDDPERSPDYIDRMMQLATPHGAAAYCARKHWRSRGTVAAAEEELAGIDLDNDTAPPTTPKGI